MQYIQPIVVDLTVFNTSVLFFRVTHPGLGLPEELVHEMFGRGRGMTQEGLGLSMCRKLVKLMNGTVQYIRETGKSCFLVEVELPLAQRDDAGSVRSTVVQFIRATIYEYFLSYITFHILVCARGQYTGLSN